MLTLDPDSLAGLPQGIDGSQYRWVDLDGEGLSGILADVGGAWNYKRNLSAANQVPQPTAPPPRGHASARWRPSGRCPRAPTCPAPADGPVGDGRLDVVALAEPDAGYFERTPTPELGAAGRFAALPQLDWTDQNITFADITGDGLADILLTEDGLFTLDLTRRTGFGPRSRCARHGMRRTARRSCSPTAPRRSSSPTCPATG